MNGNGYGIKSHNILMSPAASQMYHASGLRGSNLNHGSAIPKKQPIFTGRAIMKHLSVLHT